MSYVQSLKTGSALKPKINASFVYHNIGWNEWTSQYNCLELDLHIDASESLTKIGVQSYLEIICRYLFLEMGRMFPVKINSSFNYGSNLLE